MALDAVNPREISTILSGPRKARLGGVYYLGYGRNAWRSTWVNVYNQNCVSFDLNELKGFAEGQRTQGSVLKIQSLPLIPILYGKDLFGIAPINDGHEYQYQILRQAIREVSPQEFWHTFPLPRENWILTFRINSWDVLVSNYMGLRWRARSIDSRSRLTWDAMPAARFPRFEKFAKWLGSYSGKNWK